MTNDNTNIKRSLYRIAGLLALALVAASIQYQPSVALPLLGSGLSSHASQPFALFHQPIADAAPRSTVTFNNVHSLLTTPKLDPALTSVENARTESLSIRTEFRTERIISRPSDEVRFTAALPAGTKKIVRREKPTIVAITQRVTLWNEIVVDHHLVSRVVVQHGRPGLIVAGPPRNVAEAMAVTGVHKLIAVYAMVATAYTADSAQSAPTGRTATGVPARYGVVAVDPRIIRLGTHLYIEGYGAAIAADTGGDIHGNRIDLCMDSWQRAIDWGRQPVKVYVLGE